MIFRDVEGAPPIAKDGVSALMQRLKKIPIRLGSRKVLRSLYSNFLYISRSRYGRGGLFRGSENPLFQRGKTREDLSFRTTYPPEGSKEAKAGSTLK